MTRMQRLALEHVAWATEHFGALVTGRYARKREVMALAAKGLVADAGMVAVCDADGFLLQPGRYRRGWKITESGRMALESAP